MLHIRPHRPSRRRVDKQPHRDQVSLGSPTTQQKHEQNGRLVAAALALDANDYEDVELYSIEVAPDVRRRGVARWLAFSAIHELAPLPLVAYCTPEGAALLASCGFLRTKGEIERGGVVLTEMRYLRVPAP